MALTRFLLRGGMVASAGRLAALLTTLAVSALVARLLAPAEVGLFFLAFSVVTVASTVAQLGLGRTAVVRVSESLAAKDPGWARSVIFAVLRLGLLGGSAVALVLAAGPGVLLMRLLGSDAGVLLMAIAGAWVLGRAMESLVSEVFRGLKRIGHAVWFNQLLSGLILIVVLVALLSGRAHAGWRPGTGHVVAAAGAAAILAAVVGTARLRWVIPGPLDGDGPSSARLLNESWPVLLTTLLVMVSESAGLWILGAVTRDQAGLALFGAAARVSRFVVTPLVIANAVLMPVIVQLHARQERRRLTAALRLSATLTALPALAAVLVLAAAGKPILGLLFGPYYRDAALLLAILATGQLLAVSTGSCGATLLMTGRHRDHLVLNILSLAVLLVAGVASTRAFGATGMAVATLIGGAFQQSLFLLTVRRRLGIWTCATWDPRRLSSYWHTLSEEPR